jgi:lipopolysaccharide export system ATP-binding protein
MPKDDADNRPMLARWPTVRPTRLVFGLQVVSIAKSYDKRAVLTDISLEVAKGEVWACCAPMARARRRASIRSWGWCGRIRGASCSTDRYYQSADVSPRDSGPWLSAAGNLDLSRLTVEQNISTVLELVEPDPATRAGELERLLEEFGLTRLRSSPSMALSGGERRRAKSPAHWPPSLRSCCWTNLLRASIRCPSRTFAIWCMI